MSAIRLLPDRLRVALLPLGLALAACSTTPTQPAPPAVPAAGYLSVPLPDRTSAGSRNEPQQFEEGSPIPPDWWTLLGSRKLDSLITAAESANPSIDAARATLRVATESAAVQRGSLFPTVDVQYSPTRTKIAGNQGGSAPGIQGDGSVIQTYQGKPAADGGAAPFNAPVTYSYHTAQVNVGFVPDVFGVVRGQVRAADADARVQAFELAAARVALAANLASAAIQDGLLRRELAIVEGLRDAAVAQSRLARRQQERGYLSRASLASQELASAQAEGAVTALRRQLFLNQDLLRVLCGFTSEHVLPEFDLDEFTLPKDLPLLVPSTLVARRPDIQAAAEALRAADFRAGVAHQARLPQLSLSANFGGTAAHFDQMFWSSGNFFSVAGNLVQPLFRGGALLHQERAARAAVALAEAQYRATVLTAFQNVADSLQALLTDADIDGSNGMALDAARTASDLAHRQLSAGEIDRLTALSADQVRLQAELSLAQSRASRLEDTTALLVALGGQAPDGVPRRMNDTDER